MTEYSDDERQDVEWEAIYHRLSAYLAPLGENDAFGEGDYWLLDDNWGNWQHKLHVASLDLLRPEVITGIQRMLESYPDWSIVVAVDSKGMNWPAMGLVIRSHEIIDGLQREYFPPEYRDIHYPGSRVGTDRD
ncbi:MAG TPA: hypothetical protein VNQ99_00120 [Xanthobacteraceae bacterium]|nr:hypothetical protein [Xanthobacteraceae bacterium]